MSTGLNTHLVTWGAVGDFENALGGTGNDTITGTSGANNLSGNAGNDTITGGGGNDFIDGGDGNDTIDAGSGNNTLVGGLGDDSLTADIGDDTFQNFFGAFGHDTITDAGGTDTLDLSNYASGDALSWEAVDTNSNTFVDQLVINMIGGDQIKINNFFHDTSTDADTSTIGDGYLESINFSDTTYTHLTDVTALIM